MSYAITNAKGLAGIGHPITPRAIAPVLGGMPGDTSPMTVDGTTTGDREMMIAALSMQVAEWQQQMQAFIDSNLSVHTTSGLLARGPFFWPAAIATRANVVAAKNDLSSRFLPAIAAALRDYTRPTAPIMEVAVDYLKTLAEQFKCQMTAEAQATLRGFAKEVKKQTISNANALLSAARDAAKGATEGVFPAWVAPVAGLFVVAYLWNTLRGGFR